MENLYKKVLQEIDQLVEIIECSEEYQAYLRIQQKMSQNKELMQLIDNIKKTEQNLAKKEQLGLNKEDIIQILNELISKLEEYPIYQEYQVRQEDLNQQFQLIKNTINYYFDNES